MKRKKNIKLKMIYQSQWRILNQITPTSFSWHNFKNFSSVSESHSELKKCNDMTEPQMHYHPCPCRNEVIEVIERKPTCSIFKRINEYAFWSWSSLIFEFVLKLKLVNRSENPKNIPTFVLFLRRMNRTDY